MLNDEILLSTVVVIISLLLIASVTAMVLKRIKFPYTIGLVVVGILISIFTGHVNVPGIESITLSPALILYVLLPTLIFEASLNIDARLLWKNIWPVILLAAPGLVVSTVIVGFFMHATTPLLLGGAMLFGALISATDPVAVIALFKELGAPRRLTLLVDGESLFNDATAIVMFNIVMAMIVSGAAISMGTITKGAFDFAYVFLGGLFVGGLLGYLMVKIIAFAKNDAMIEVALSTIVAYAAFILADRVCKVSGVMSAMGAGLVVSWFGSTRFVPEVKQCLKNFWEVASFAANSFIFLLLGFTEEKLIVDIFIQDHLYIYVLMAVLACLIARSVIIYGILPFMGRFKSQQKVSMAYQTVMFWGGLRGAVPLALVLSLPADFEHRRLIIELTLGVVLFTLLIQGTTMRRLMHLFKLDKISVFNKMLALQTKLDSNAKAINSMKEMEDNGFFPERLIVKFKTGLNKSDARFQQELNDFKDAPGNAAAIKRLIWSEALTIKRNTFRKLYDNGILSEIVMRNLEELVRLSMEALAEEQLPDLESIYGTHPNLKIDKKLFRFFARLAPKDNRYIKRYRIKAVLTNYEEFAAIVAATTNVEKGLSHLAELYSEFPEVIKECRDFHKNLEDIAKKNIVRLEKTHAAGIEEIQLKLLYRICINSEINAVNELVENGNIPESVAETILEKMKNTLAFVKK